MHVDVKQVLLRDDVGAARIRQAVLVDVREHGAVAAGAAERLDGDQPLSILEPQPPGRLVKQHPARQEQQRDLRSSAAVSVPVPSVRFPRVSVS